LRKRKTRRPRSEKRRNGELNRGLWREGGNPERGPRREANATGAFSLLGVGKGIETVRDVNQLRIFDVKRRDVVEDENSVLGGRKVPRKEERPEQEQKGRDRGRRRFEFLNHKKKGVCCGGPQTGKRQVHPNNGESKTGNNEPLFSCSKRKPYQRAKK